MKLNTGAAESLLTAEEAKRFLSRLANSMQVMEKSYAKVLKDVDPQFQISARNLLHYLKLRSEDIRPLQQYLHNVGLSSLTSSESHTLFQVLQVLRWLDPYADFSAFETDMLCYFARAIELRKKHRIDLLGRHAKRKLPHIMVTLSPELAEDTERIQDLLRTGMTVARINCAHDTPEMWLTMIEAIRANAVETGRTCKIYMDLPGPKIRIAEVPMNVDSPEGLRLQEGDMLELTEDRQKLRKVVRAKDGKIKTPARVVVQPEGITGMMKEGERIFFDDGKFEACIVRVKKKSVGVLITRISTRKPLLRPSKGVNLPDSELAISALTAEDLQHLQFVARHADLVGYSFVSAPADVALLRDQLRSFQTKAPAIILKIERLSAVQNLPALLLEGMKDKSFGVMIARGDLAVEIGFERLSEIQQEILWICEAAHIPVIWATQVLENMNKTGFATRSEITDAAMGGMAECVMLNKGKHVVKAVSTLVDILTRFTAHADKKRFTFRPLSIASNFLQSESE